ncbi:MAG: subtilase family protease, partial [Cyanobacteria bacterium P01_G01_bin.4]
LQPDTEIGLSVAIAYTAQWPKRAQSSHLTQADILNQFGYGIPDVSRLQADNERSVRYATPGEPWIKPLQADVYRVSVPDAWLAQPPETQFRISVVLAYKAQPHRTEQGRSRYLSTWLDWRCSRRGEPKLSFLGRVLQDYQAPEAVEEVKGSFKWEIGNRKRRDPMTGKLIRLSRSDSTLQKDWAVTKRSELGQQFFVAVIGHRGWNSDPEASAPYSLSRSKTLGRAG